MRKITIQKEGEEKQPVMNAVQVAKILEIHPETVRIWCRLDINKIVNGYTVITNVKED